MPLATEGLIVIVESALPRAARLRSSGVKRISGPRLAHRVQSFERGKGIPSRVETCPIHDGAREPKCLAWKRSHLYKKAEQLGIDLRALRREQGARGLRFIPEICLWRAGPFGLFFIVLVLFSSAFATDPPSPPDYGVRMEKRRCAPRRDVEPDGAKPGEKIPVLEYCRTAKMTARLRKTIPSTRIFARRGYVGARVDIRISVPAEGVPPERGIFRAGKGLHGEQGDRVLGASGVVERKCSVRSEFRGADLPLNRWRCAT